MRFCRAPRIISALLCTSSLFLTAQTLPIANIVLPDAPVVAAYDISSVTAPQAQKNPPATNQEPDPQTTDKNTAASTDAKDKSTNSLPTDVSVNLGIGSLIRNGNVTDYTNTANILTATSLGWATPQYLVGLYSAHRSRTSSLAILKTVLKLQYPRLNIRMSIVQDGMYGPGLHS
jgi:hypothetical protein